MDIRAVIMAGGKGTRFWPLSRKNRPKQFLPIISEKTMLEETASRLLPLLPPSNIYTVAGKEMTEVIHRILPDIPQPNLLVEPEGKNTAPSLMLATAAIYLRNPKAVVIALPADHLILDAGRFRNKLAAGARAAADGEHFITFGIPPSFPATGYGYIRFSPGEKTVVSGEAFHPVETFKEKPGYRQAKEFLDAGCYFWNSGMFIWQAESFREKLSRYAPELHRFWPRMLESLEKNRPPFLDAVFAEMPAVSIDYALMEKARPIWMCRGDFGWSDVGAWSALAEVWPRDEQGNTLRGEAVTVDSEGCLLYNPGKLTALIGVKDLIVVDTEDALLVCRKDLDQKVKDIVDMLKKGNREEYL